MKQSSSNVSSKLICLLALFVAAVFIVADMPAHAQNSNSSSTMSGDSMMQQNSNMSSNTTRRRPRPRPRRRARSNNMNSNTGDASMPGDANMSGDTSGNANMSGDASMQNMNMAGDTQDSMNSNMSAPRRGRRGRRGTRNANANANLPGDATTTTTPDDATTAPADANANMPADTNANMPADTVGVAQSGGTQSTGTPGDVADLSGTYTGTANYAEGGMSGEATLTITGNTFTLTGGAANVTGTLSARSWPGYTALSMRFGDTVPATIISTRAWHKGKSLRIQSVKGETRAFTFNGRAQ